MPLHTNGTSFGCDGSASASGSASANRRANIGASASCFDSVRDRSDTTIDAGRTTKAVRHVHVHARHVVRHGRREERAPAMVAAGAGHGHGHGVAGGGRRGPACGVCGRGHGGTAMGRS